MSEEIEDMKLRGQQQFELIRWRQLPKLSLTRIAHELRFDKTLVRLAGIDWTNGNDPSGRISEKLRIAIKAIDRVTDSQIFKDTFSIARNVAIKIRDRYLELGGRI